MRRLGGLLERRLDLVVARLLLEADDEVDDGDVDGGDTEGETTVQTRQYVEVRGQKLRRT